MKRLAALLGYGAWAGCRLALRSGAASLRFGDRRRRRRQVLGEELARLCEALGPTWIKIGQILSSRPDLLPPAVVAPLVRLQREVAPIARQTAAELVTAALGRPPEEVFAALDPVPVAAASVAQVHWARLPDGREVAVKLRRPGVVEQVAADFRLLGSLARSLERLPGLGGLPCSALIGEFEGPIRRQLDFRLEAASNVRLRANLAHAERLRIPAVVPELSGEAILTLEFVPTLVSVTATELGAEERRALALAGLRALYRMIFLDGFVHADLHPGNVFVGPRGELVMLDTGLVAELDDEDLQDFVDFFFGLINNRPEECARVVHDTALHRAPAFDRDRFDGAMAELIGRHSAKKSHEFEVTAFAAQLLALQRRQGLTGSTKFILTILSMVVYDGICKALYPECDFQAEARGYLIHAKYRRHPARAV